MDYRISWLWRWKIDSIGYVRKGGHIMVRTATVHFKCPHCDALYQVVKAEAGPETSIDGEIPCRICGGPLAARDGEFVLKYFLLRKAARRAPRMGERG